jgi:glycosyltransferase involved in cell wall biosynthesis
MIAHNEEDWIGGSIKSVLPVADRVVVALNNSTDRTREICEELGAEIRECEFDNFSQVRNVSKEGVDTDWILWIDSDERLVYPDKLRKYTTGAIYNGFAIRQNHLMLDLPGTSDLPIRLFRNLPQFKFVGYIHEHCEDTSENPFDDTIQPTLLLPDVDIAHYGYLHEKARRYKCSARNMELLIRDVEDNGMNGRMLTWVLVIRDYINMVKWSAEKTQAPQVVPGSFEHSCLNAAIATFINHFEDSGHRYEVLARPMYEEALSLLGKSGIPFADCSTPPFEIGLALFGAVGGLEDKNVGASTKWFRDGDEYTRFIMEQGNGLTERLRVPANLLGAEQEYKEYPEPPHLEMLAQGLNAIDRGA